MSRRPAKAREVRERLAGLTDRELSETTIKAHISCSLAKLGLTNRVQLAFLVHDAGLADEGAPGGG
ncbi:MULTISPECIES: LuxR C-terminal-related transcriptional regulator [Streptomyces]|uniref:LuxR C-terminal-related transcriptional regulator n=1 Tax=Streptomyces lycopersici TaxID=2974589 RepID=UPI0035253D9B